MLAILMGRPFTMDFDRLMEADVDELLYFMKLAQIRTDMEKRRG